MQTNMNLQGLARKLSRAANKIISAKMRRHSNVGPPELWRMKRDFQIAFLKSQGLESGHSLIDIGCGTLRGGVPLIDYLDPGNYCGLEVRAQILEEGRRELEEHGLSHKEPRLIAYETFADLSALPRFDYAWAFSVLFHMTDEILADCFAFIGEHLEPDGCFLANVHLGDARDTRWEQFPVVWRSEEHYLRLAEANGLGMETLGELRELGHVSGIADQDEQTMLRFRRR